MCSAVYCKGCVTGTGGLVSGVPRHCSCNKDQYDMGSPSSNKVTMCCGSFGSAATNAEGLSANRPTPKTGVRLTELRRYFLSAVQATCGVAVCWGQQQRPVATAAFVLVTCYQLYNSASSIGCVYQPCQCKSRQQHSHQRAEVKKLVTEMVL
jgi:hypothetical protein